MVCICLRDTSWVRYADVDGNKESKRTLRWSKVFVILFDVGLHWQPTLYVLRFDFPKSEPLLLFLPLTPHPPLSYIYLKQSLSCSSHFHHSTTFSSLSTKCPTKILPVTLKNLVLWPESSWPDLNMRVLGQLLEEA